MSRYSHTIFAAVFWAVVLSAGHLSVLSVDLSAFEDGQTVDFRDMDVHAAVRQLETRFQIRIQGLAHRYGQKMSFVCSGPVPQVMAQFLRQLNETDYAFFYKGNRLSRIVVVNGGVNTGAAGAVHDPLPENTDPTEESDALAEVAYVRDVLENTTAEKIGLQPGDIIIEYDGVKISHFSTLKKQTRLAAHKPAVSMTIVRDRAPLRMFLEPGVIGVVMGLQKIPARELAGYYAD